MLSALRPAERRKLRKAMAMNRRIVEMFVQQYEGTQCNCRKDGLTMDKEKLKGLKKS